MVSKERWKNYLKVQMSGKRNMFGYDMTIQTNYEKIYQHFEVEKKIDNWRGE